MLSRRCRSVPLTDGSLILVVLRIQVGPGMMRTLAWYDILYGILHLIGYGVLLFRAIKYNQQAVLVNLVFTAKTIVLSIIFVIMVLASLETFLLELRGNCASMPELKQAGMT